VLDGIENALRHHIEHDVHLNAGSIVDVPADMSEQKALVPHVPKILDVGKTCIRKVYIQAAMLTHDILDKRQSFLLRSRVQHATLNPCGRVHLSSSFFQSIKVAGIEIGGVHYCGTGSRSTQYDGSAYTELRPGTSHEDYLSSIQLWGETYVI